MTKAEEGSGATATPEKTYRALRKKSDAGRRYFDICAVAGKTQNQFFRFIDNTYPNNVKTIRYYIRQGKTANDDVKGAMIHFLRDTPYAINEEWFDCSWHPVSIIDQFVQASGSHPGLHKELCGEFVRVTPRSNIPDQAGSSEIIHRKLSVFPDESDTLEKGRILRWNEGKDGLSISTEGFVLHDSLTAFLFGLNVDDKNILTYTVLKRPPRAISNLGVRFFGFQAGTLPIGPPNGYGIAKRTILVDPSVWEKWMASEEFPEGVKEWLLADGHGLLVDLVRGLGDDQVE